MLMPKPAARQRHHRRISELKQHEDDDKYEQRPALENFSQPDRFARLFAITCRSGAGIIDRAGVNAGQGAGSRDAKAGGDPVIVFVAAVLYARTGGVIKPALAAIGLGLVGHSAFSGRVGRNQPLQCVG